jgi:hypothetical protein
MNSYTLKEELETGYYQMAQDEIREAVALEWSKITIRDAFDEP